MIKNIEKDEREALGLLSILQDQLSSCLKESQDIATELDQKKKEKKDLQSENTKKIVKLNGYDSKNDEYLAAISQKDEQLQLLMQQQTLKEE